MVCMMKKKKEFKCRRCKNNFPIEEESFIRGRSVCQRCFKIIRKGYL
jgi:formylmethanofuran dehydrogenase subunit E